MDSQISVLTLVKGRKKALLNLIYGLTRNSQQQIELVVIHMNEETYELPATTFPIRSFSYTSIEKLPLAKARNLAVAQANSHYCVFLDVDCIPAADFIMQYQIAFAMHDQLWSGTVRYLREGFPSFPEDHILNQWSDPDPIRGNLDQLPYELFWSLNFGCSKKVFAQIGGFDENYAGYGAEDTDFSFAARKNSVALALLPAVAYHQPHASYQPPVNHLEDIVINANLFFKKWKRWPMEGWLQKFEDLGFVSWTTNSLLLKKSPSVSALERYRK